MDDVEQSFDEYEISVGADEADLKDYVEFLTEVISTAKARLAAAQDDLFGS